MAMRKDHGDRVPLGSVKGGGNLSRLEHQLRREWAIAHGLPVEEPAPEKRKGKGKRRVENTRPL